MRSAQLSLLGHCRNWCRSQNTIIIMLITLIMIAIIIIIMTILIIHATDQTAVSLSEMSGRCSRLDRHITKMDEVVVMSPHLHVVY